jgi:hypothetical protein
MPGLVWNGYLPELSTPTAMPADNRVCAELSDATKAQILVKIQELRALLPFLLNLTLEERREPPKMGDKTVAFDQKCQSYMTARPELVPTFVNLPELAKDRTLRLQLADVFNELNSLCEAVDDTMMVVGSEILMSDLSFYQNVRQAAQRNVTGVDVIYEDLRQRFPGRGRTTPPTPPSP